MTSTRPDTLATTRTALEDISLSLPIPARLHRAAVLIEPELQAIDAAAGPHWYATRLATLATCRGPVARLFTPEQDGLRLPPEGLADAYLDMLFGRPRTPAGDQEPACLAALTQLFVKGALTPVQPLPAAAPAGRP